MKQIFNIFFIISLLVDCASESGENNNAFQLILGIVNQQPLTLNHSDRKSSELVIIDIPMHYVDSISGNDSNAGTKSAPYRTITKAILASKADGTKVIYVAPGTYDTSIGETFPISIPDGVNLYGDYDGKGLVGGSSSFYAGPPGTTPKTGPTWINGGGFDVNNTAWNATIIPKNNSQIAGFKIINPNPLSPGGYFTRGISIQNFVSIKIRNNTITGMSSGAGIYIEYFTVTAVGSNTISGNQITSNYWGIEDGGIRASYDKVENNFISRNFIGISTTQGLDLGQGTTGSAGNNTFSCNTYEDIMIGGSSNISKTQYAMNNYWDHFAPTMSSTHIDGLDIRNYSNTTLVYYAGGGVAPNACN
ncbi:LIC10774 family surface protein [Leptospira borgpetersenii]|uniref:PF07602 family protein n=1 Tax=Leptospira borgpetersenii str. Brem 328 TaxID=1049780 RepID=A0ABC9SN48_LEPBO|nr:DUF1565 domain-containing protein [Leptospira borgpetersenii]EMN13259.1 PF07602 family protein [Leptospira borgpetersenii str. Brem 307]EMN19142.1 PF07602 family protein [Leptospira borgpetersenii str. Brem 328]